MNFFVNYIHLVRYTLVIYTSTFRYSLASSAFGKAKYYVICRELPMGSKFQWKIYFFQFLFIDKYT